MFGQKNNDDNQDDLSAMDQAAQQVVADATGDSTPPASDETVSIPPVPDSVTSDPTTPMGDTPVADQANFQPDTEPAASEDTPGSAPAITDVISPYSDNPTPTPAPQPPSSLPPIPIPSFTPASSDTPSQSVPAPASEPASEEESVPAGSEDLIDIKQKALGELSPLIDELDQPPEDKFRTVMMMIQASDDRALVPKAYEIAHSIEDEKARAQALLDVVNEINYFTQQPQN